MIEQARDLLLANQLVLTGALWAAAGYVMYTCRRLWTDVRGRLVSRAICTIEVTGHDPAFSWLVNWLGAQPYALRCRRLSVTGYKPTTHDSSDAPVSASECRTSARFFPAPGIHAFRYAGRFVWVDLRKEKSEGYNPFNESIKISALTSDPDFIRRLVEDADRLAHPTEDERLSVYAPSFGSWSRVARVLPRPLDSVVLPEGQTADLVEDIETFIDRRDWYQQRGIPWHRGYLFHGVPGSGKSSLCKALAAHFGRSIYLLSLSDQGINDSRLAELLSAVPENAFVVFEDVDAAFVERQAKKDEPGLTFSGLLNALDGIAAPDGRVLFMTTNHRERLDPALIRPGRSDKHVAFDFASDGQIERLYCRFYPCPPAEDVNAFVREVRATYGGATMAEVQELLIARERQEDVCFPEMAADTAITTAFNQFREHQGREPDFF